MRAERSKRARVATPMKLSEILLLVGLLAVPVVLFGQFLWVRRPDFRRRRARLLQGALLFFPLLAVAHCRAKRLEAPPPEPVWTTTWPESRDGSQPPPSPPPPPNPPPLVERAEDCPPQTRFRGGLCFDAANRVVPAPQREPAAQ